MGSLLSRSLARSPALGPSESPPGLSAPITPPLSGKMGAVTPSIERDLSPLGGGGAPPPSLLDALALFEMADKNQNGRLSHGELKKLLKAQSWAEALLASPDFHWKSLFGEVLRLLL